MFIGKLPAPNRMERLTVLLCTHNRVSLLERAIASINSARRLQGWDVELLVVANSCVDETETFLARYRATAEDNGLLPLSWFAEPNPGKSNALNAALPRLSNELVAFVDDDHRVDENYLAAVCREAEENPDTDLFCGRILPDWNGLEPDWVHDNDRYKIYPLPVPRFDLGSSAMELDGSTVVPGGGNLAVRTRILPRVGPFDNTYGPKGHNLEGGEDLEWVRRALKVGARLRYTPDMLQFHFVDLGRLTLSYVMQKAYKRSASSIRLRPERIANTLLPLHMLRKALTYLGMVATSWQRRRLRFYLVRLAAALGEIHGHLETRHELRSKYRGHPG